MTWFRIIVESGYDTATYRTRAEAINAYKTVLKGQHGDQWQEQFKAQQPRLLIAMSRRAAILADTRDNKVISCELLNLTPPPEKTQTADGLT